MKVQLNFYALHFLCQNNGKNKSFNSFEVFFDLDTCCTQNNAHEEP